MTRTRRCLPTAIRTGAHRPPLQRDEQGRRARCEPYLVQLPVELGRAEGVGLVEVLPQEEDQAAVVHVQGVVVPVHFCRQSEGWGGEGPCVSVSLSRGVFRPYHLAHRQGHWRSRLSFTIGSEECSRTYVVELIEMQEGDSRKPTVKLLRCHLGFRYQPTLSPDTASDPNKNSLG